VWSGVSDGLQLLDLGIWASIMPMASLVLVVIKAPVINAVLELLPVFRVSQSAVLLSEDLFCVYT